MNSLPSAEAKRLETAGVLSTDECAALDLEEWRRSGTPNRAGRFAHGNRIA